MKTLITVVLILFMQSEYCNAQTFVVDQKIPSLRAPFGLIVPYAVTVQMETRSVTTGKQVLTGTAYKIPSLNFFSDDVIFADMPGSKSVPVTVSSLRVTLTTNLAAKWEQVSPWPFRVWLDKPYDLLPGQVVGCRYDMPAQTFLWAKSLLEMKMVWNTEETGNLRCAVGVKAASIDKMIVVTPTPTPVADKPVDPAPAPGTDTTTAPNKPGESSPPRPHLIAGDGAQWTLENGVIKRSGVVMPLPYEGITSIEIPSSGMMLAFNPTKGYSCWTGAGWVGATRC